MGIFYGSVESVLSIRLSLVSRKNLGLTLIASYWITDSCKIWELVYFNTC